MPIVIGASGVERIVEIAFSTRREGDVREVGRLRAGPRRRLQGDQSGVRVSGIAGVSARPRDDRRSSRAGSPLTIADDEARAHEHPRIPGQGRPEGVRRAGLARPAIYSPDEAEAAARELGGPLWVVKSQIHAGGRGKGKFKEPRPATRAACASPRRSTRSRPSPGRCSATRWSPLQTGPAGKQVNRLYIEDGSDIEKRVLPLDAGRPRDQPRRLRGLDRRRHGHRGGRARHAGEDRHLLGRSRRPAIMPHHGRTRRQGARA